MTKVYWGYFKHPHYRIVSHFMEKFIFLPSEGWKLKEFKRKTDKVWSLLERKKEAAIESGLTFNFSSIDSKKEKGLGKKSLTVAVITYFYAWIYHNMK